ncbi:DUF389 domain-containing protein [Ruegeria sp. ANG-S4]|uniref:DUF389 domain-containing protein n=1 Tax=Ruegeria sp. ANG-S4 TaxID=1577904 RepID=UPI00068E548F|nr:DUF389 domain-containing protein [Ruegeria sp. ANG-S4]
MPIDKYSTTRDILRFEGPDRVAYWKRFSMLLGLSVIAATMGLVRNSGAVVIAAMLIAPLMAPILGIAASMVVGRNSRVLSLLGIVFLAACLSVGLAWLIVYVADVPKGTIVPEQIMSRTDPGTEDLIIALVAGVAGAYVQVNRAEVSLLPGAAIGVSLVPPLSAAGVLLYFDNYADAYEAVLLFSTNLAAIVLSACAVYVITGGVSVVFGKSKRRAQFTVSLVLTIVVLAAIAMQLVSATFNRYSETRAESELSLAIQDWSGSESVEIVRLDVNAAKKRADIWIIVDLPIEAQRQVASVSELLPDHLKDGRLVDRMRGVLGSDYAVAFRYQIRFAGLIFLGSEFVVDAPKVEETSDE